MVVFIISYDLRKPDYDYQPLYDALAEIEAKHIQDSIWAVRTDSSAIQIFDYLWRYMHNEKDRLFVVPFDKAKSYKAKNSIEPLKSV